MALIISVLFGVVVGGLWFMGHTAIAVGIVAALLLLTHISVWLK